MPFPDDPNKPRTPSVAGAPAITRPTTPAPAPTPIGTAVGSAVRTGARVAQTGATAAAAAGINALTYLPRAAGGVARDFSNAVLGNPASPNAGQPLSGLAIPRPGAAPAATPTATAAPSTAAMPNFSNVPAIPRPTAPAPQTAFNATAPFPRPTMPTSPVATPAPAQNAVSPAVAGGGLNPADRVLGTFTGRNGTQTITQSSADALAAKLPTAGGPVATGPGGSFAYTPGASPGSTTGIAPQAGVGAPAIPRPSTVQQNVGYNGTQLKFAGMDRDAYTRGLDEQIAKIGEPDRRSKRDLLATLLQQKGAALNQGSDIAARLAGAELGSSTDLAGKNIGEAGASYRADAALSAQINRPEYETDANGTVNAISNGIARPVIGEGGKPLRKVTEQQRDQQRLSAEAAKAQREQGQIVRGNIAKLAGDYLPVGKDPTPQDISSARMKAAMQQGLKDFYQGPNGEVGVMIDGELVQL